MNRVLQEHFRCPDQFADIEVTGDLGSTQGYFQFGADIVCYGQTSGSVPSHEITQNLPNALQAAVVSGHSLRLPFDLSQVVDNLRLERYCANGNSKKNALEGDVTRDIYYFFRPVLPIKVRKHLQRARLRGWDQIPFPRWPVDFTADLILEQAMALLVKGQDSKRIPFIWFWPKGAQSCVVMTHDVEAAAGRDFCDELMDLDDAAGIKSAFQIVPELRYGIQNGIIDRFRSRGFEVNVHDLNHDGTLFHDRAEFLRRAGQINHYAREFGTRGFRAGGMYRNQDWFEAFELLYDMSVPNVAHLEPQRGGCCTVFPYFIGEILELPLTTTQDYSLFHILGDYSIELWKKQIALIRRRHGLISFITHPDYLIEKNARNVYRDLLNHLTKLKANERLWVALPGEVDRWWRNRNQMNLIRNGGTWCIEGPDKDRACVAYASLENDQLVYTLDAAV